MGGGDSGGGEQADEVGELRIAADGGDMAADEGETGAGTDTGSGSGTGTGPADMEGGGVQDGKRGGEDLHLTATEWENEEEQMAGDVSGKTGVGHADEGAEWQEGQRLVKRQEGIMTGNVSVSDGRIDGVNDEL